MFMFFSSLLGSFGFFIFFVWILISLITKDQKKIPTIGFIVITTIFITGILIPIPISATNDKSNNEYKNVVAGKSVNVNTEWENSINSDNDSRQKVIEKGTNPKKLDASGQITVELITYKTSLNSDNIAPQLTTYNQVTNSGSNVSSNSNSENIIIKDPKVEGNSSKKSNYNISKEQGLKIVTSKVNVAQGLQVLYDSERVIKGKTYLLYTLNTDVDTLEDVAYCVDVSSGDLFKCTIDMVLTTIE